MYTTMWLTTKSRSWPSGAIPATSQKILASIHFIDKAEQGRGEALGFHFIDKAGVGGTQRGRVTCPKANMSKGTQVEI